MRFLRNLTILLILASLWLVSLPALANPSPQSDRTEITIDNVEQVAELDRIGNGSISDFAISPDGQTIGVASTIGVWLIDIATQDHTYFPTVHTNVLKRIAWSPDGQFIATGDWSGMIVVINAETGETLHTLTEHTDAIEFLTFSPDSQTLLSGAWYKDQTMRLWDMQTGEVIHVFRDHINSLSDAAFTPDGERIISGADDQTVRIWDVESGDLLTTIHPNDRHPISLDLSADATLAFVGQSRGNVVLVDLENEEIRWDIEDAGGNVFGIAKSPIADEVTIGTYDGTLRVYDTQNGEFIREIDQLNGNIRNVIYSDDGLILYTATVYTLRYYDTNSGDILGDIDLFEYPNIQLPYGAETSTRVTQKDGQWVEVDRSTDTVIRVFENLNLPDAYNLSILPDGERALVQWLSDDLFFEGYWEVIDISTGESLFEMIPPYRSNSSLLSPNGDIFSVVLWDGSIDSWDLNTGNNLPHISVGNVESIGTAAIVRTAFWSPDSQYLIAIYGNDIMRFWDMTTGRIEHQYSLAIQLADESDFTWLSDGTMLIVETESNTARLRNIETNDVLIEFVAESEVLRLTLSPNNQLVAFSTEDGILGFVDFETAEILHTVRGHIGRIALVEWSLDGTTVLTHGRDTTRRIWGIPES